MDPVVIETNRTLKGVFADLWDYRELFLFLGMARSIGWLQADRHRPGVECDHAPAHDGDSHPGVRPPGQTSSGGVPYPVLVFAGLLPWQFFSSVLSQSSASLVNNRNMVSKVYFPRIIIPSTQVVVSLTDLVISLAILAGLMSLYGIAPSLCLLFLPLLIGLAILRSLGVGYWISALNVKYRDFRYIVPFKSHGGCDRRIPLGDSRRPLGTLRQRSRLLGPAGCRAVCQRSGVLPQGRTEVRGRDMSAMIEMEGLGKQYWIRHEKAAQYETLREWLMHAARSAWHRMRYPLSPNLETADVEAFWALRDIDRTIERGDRVGIIGVNGAGKSTLLKVLSRITEPSTGPVTLRGRVASLLEVGTGFHPELSGREKVYLNGAILGMFRREIRNKFDEIVAFAEVERFLDTPVKRYSRQIVFRATIDNIRSLQPKDGIAILLNVEAAGRYNRAYLGDAFRGKLAPALDWKTERLP